VIMISLKLLRVFKPAVLAVCVCLSLSVHFVCWGYSAVSKLSPDVLSWSEVELSYLHYRSTYVEFMKRGPAHKTKITMPRLACLYWIIWLPFCQHLIGLIPCLIVSLAEVAHTCFSGRIRLFCCVTKDYQTLTYFPMRFRIIRKALASVHWARGVQIIDASPMSALENKVI
jgi:hypothetical protein